jgi:hypothetical protein
LLQRLSSSVGAASLAAHPVASVGPAPNQYPTATAMLTNAEMAALALVANPPINHRFASHLITAHFV